VVDFRFRCSLSAGLAVSLLGCASGVSPVQRFPQESSTFRYNQLYWYGGLIYFCTPLEKHHFLCVERSISSRLNSIMLFHSLFTGKLCHAISFRWGGERRRLLRKNGRDKTPQRMRGGLAVRPPESEAVPLTIYPYTYRQSLSSSYVRKQASLRKELLKKRFHSGIVLHFIDYQFSPGTNHGSSGDGLPSSHISYLAFRSCSMDRC
jgi:hypothetical protein